MAKNAGRGIREMSQKFDKCSFPSCDGNYNPQRTGKIPLCVRHCEMMKFFLWMMENVKIKDEQKAKSGLILP